MPEKNYRKDEALIILDEALILTEEVHNALKRLSHCLRHNLNIEDPDDLQNRMNRLTNVVFDDCFLEWVFGENKPTNLTPKKRDFSALKILFDMEAEKEKYLGYPLTSRQLASYLNITTREVHSLRLRFNPDGTFKCTQKVVAEQLGVSSQRVKQITEKALKKLSNFKKVQDESN